MAKALPEFWWGASDGTVLHSTAWLDITFISASLYCLSFFILPIIPQQTSTLLSTSVNLRQTSTPNTDLSLSNSFCAAWCFASSLARQMVLSRMSASYAHSSRAKRHRLRNISFFARTCAFAQHKRWTPLCAGSKCNIAGLEPLLVDSVMI
jgi:hypothetical protein